MLLYHGSFIGNVSSILERGIVPRKELIDCDRWIDSILADYGLIRSDIPSYKWGPDGSFGSALTRCKETAAYVYLSADYDYALGNSLAGFEAEDALRNSIAIFMSDDPDTFKHLYIPPERESVVCEVDVPDKFVFDEHSLEVIERYRQHPEWMAKWPEEAFIRGLFQQVRLDRPVPRTWIKRCFTAMRPEFYTTKKLSSLSKR